MIVLVPNVGTPWTRDRLVTSQTNSLFISVSLDQQLHRFSFQVKFNTNLSNNLSILPDLDSNRISIRHRSYLSTFSVVWTVLCQILCLIFLKLEINILRQWRIFLLPVLCACVFLKTRNVFKKGLGFMVNFHCKYITQFPCCCFKCLSFPCYDVFLSLFS